MLEHTKTHRSEFTRGYWVGQAVALAYVADAFSLLMPSAQVDDVLDALAEVVDADGPHFFWTCTRRTLQEPGRFGIEFVAADFSRSEVMAELTA